MRGRMHYSGSRLLETRSRQGISEVTLNNLLPSTLASHFITHNGNICRPLAQTATCRCHDEETNISQKTVDRPVRQQIARDTTRKRNPCKTLRGRKHTRRNANRKMYSAQGVTDKTRHTYKRSVNMWKVCAQPDGSMSSLLQCFDSRAYALVHIVGPLAATISLPFKEALLRHCGSWVATCVVCGKWWALTKFTAGTFQLWAVPRKGAMQALSEPAGTCWMFPVCPAGHYEGPTWLKTAHCDIAWPITANAAILGYLHPNEVGRSSARHTWQLRWRKLHESCSACLHDVCGWTRAEWWWHPPQVWRRALSADSRWRVL